MDASLSRYLALGAIGGGALRIVSAFTTEALGPQALQLSYAVTDILLLLGLAGILIAWRYELEWLGYTGVAIATIGLIIIRGTGFTSLAMSGYMIGAGVAVVGVALLAADILWRRIGPKIAPYFWIASFVLAVWGALGRQAALQALAGIAFGAGFAVIGVNLLMLRPSAAKTV